MVQAQQPFVIVGAGLAGAKAAETLRTAGFDGRVVLIGDETDRPYDRPPLSKDYLQGKSGLDKVYLRPPGWYAEHEIDLRLGTRATAIDRIAHEVAIEGGESIGYDKPLLTTGSTVRPLTVPGSDLDLEIGELPLLAVLGREMAEVYASLHRDHGGQLRLEATVAEITAEHGTTSGVRLADGSVIEADAVVVGVGITPTTGLAEAAGLAVDNGMLLDEHPGTSDPDILAAGDVANAYYPWLDIHLRLEHWSAALDQGPVAAMTMMGRAATYDRVPRFFSDQYDMGMEYSGYVAPGDGDEVVVRGDVAAREFIAFWMGGGRVPAGMNVNIWDQTDAIAALVRSDVQIAPAALADPGIPLTDLCAGTRTGTPR